MFSKAGSQVVARAAGASAALVITGTIAFAGAASASAKPFLARLRATYLPNHVVAVVDDPDRTELGQLVPLVTDKIARGGRPTAYVCEGRVCDLPTSDPDVFARQIARVEPLPTR